MLGRQDLANMRLMEDRAGVYQQLCPCMLTWSNTGISWIPRFAPECKLYSKLRLLVEQVLPHGQAFSSKQKMWMNYTQLKNLSINLLVNEGLPFLSQCNAKKAEQTPIPSTELKFQ